MTWVLVAFNLVLAICRACRRRGSPGAVGPARVALAGLVVFGAASLVCGLADSIGLLLAARCVQAVGGAAAVCASLELLPSRGRLRAPRGHGLGRARARSAPRSGPGSAACSPS